MRLWLLLLLACCGRLEFAPLGGDSALPDDDAADGPAASDGAPPTCTTGTFLCDDFESNDRTMWDGMTFVTNTTYGRLPEAKRQGAFGYRFSSPDQPAAGAVNLLEWQAEPSAPFVSTRFWFRVSRQLNDAEGIAMFTRTFRDPAAYATLGCDAAGILTFTQKTSDGSNAQTGTTTQCSPDTWRCIELNLDRSNNRLTFFLDDALQGSTSLLNPAADYALFGVGQTRIAIAGWHIDIDDVAISDRPIGCTP